MDIKTYISSGVIESYVLGNLSLEESSILECVMSKNNDVKEAVFEMQQIVEQLATNHAVKPPEFLKGEILKKIDCGDTEIGAGKIISIKGNKENSNSITSVPNWMKVASVAALLVFGYFGYEINSKNKEINQIAQNNAQLSGRLSEVENVNKILKSAKKIQLKGVEAHPTMLATVYWTDNEKVFLDIQNMPTAPSGKQYQLWAIVDGKPVDMGIYPTSKSSDFYEMKSIEKAQAFAITLEKEGGNPSPTMEQMYVMGTI